MTKPEAILFDLGNVLASIHPERFLKTLGIDVKAGGAGYQQGIIEIVRLYERGQTTTNQFLDALGLLFENRFSPGAFESAMLSVIGDPIPGMENFVRRSTERYRAALVSNTNALHFQYCLGLLPVLKLLPHRFLSFQLGTLKPEPSYYQQILQQLNLPPSKIMFVDDTPENVRGATAAGMKGTVFRDPAQLEQEFSQLQIF